MKFKKIYIEITNICNKNCSFCSKTKRSLREMTLCEFERVLQQINDYTDYVYLHIKGEPLIHKDFPSIIELCKKYNKRINLTTNGTFIHKYIDLFSNNDIFRQVNISLHSYNNFDDIKNLVNCIERIRINNKKTYFVYRYWTLNEKDSNYINLNKIIKEIYDVDINNHMNIKLDTNLYLNKDFEFIWPSISNNIDEKIGTCYGLKSHIGILSDGTVVPCCLDCEGIIDLGNIFSEELSNILNKKKTKNIIQGFKDNKKVEILCQHCSFKK